MGSLYTTAMNLTTILVDPTELTWAVSDAVAQAELIARANDGGLDFEENVGESWILVGRGGVPLGIVHARRALIFTAPDVRVEIRHTSPVVHISVDLDAEVFEIDDATLEAFFGGPRPHILRTHRFTAMDLWAGTMF